MPAVEPVSFALAPRRLWPVRLLGLAVIAAGVWLLVRGDGWAAGAATGALGAALLVVFGHFPGRAPRLVWGDDAGLHSPVADFGFVAWRDVAGLRLGAAGRRPVLLVDRTPAARGARKPMQVLFAHRAGADDLVLPLDALAAAPEQVVAALERARAQARTG